MPFLGMLNEVNCGGRDSVFIYIGENICQIIYIIIAYAKFFIAKISKYILIMKQWHMISFESREPIGIILTGLSSRHYQVTLIKVNRKGDAAPFRITI